MINVTNRFVKKNYKIDIECNYTGSINDELINSIRFLSNKIKSLENSIQMQVDRSSYNYETELLINRDICNFITVVGLSIGVWYCFTLISKK
jgi:hypothetical protein